MIDTSINYNIPVFRSVKPWLKFDVFNLFNNEKLVGCNTSVVPDPDSPRDAFGLPTGYPPGRSSVRHRRTSNFPASLASAAAGRSGWRWECGFELFALARGHSGSARLVNIELRRPEALALAKAGTDAEAAPRIRMSSLRSAGRGRSDLMRADHHQPAFSAGTVPRASLHARAR